MSDQAAQEPTMEEILASIRRIISEDDAPAEASTEDQPAAVAEPIGSEALQTEAPGADEEQDDDVLELTERVSEPAPEPVRAAAPLESAGDLDIFERPVQAPTMQATQPSPAQRGDDGLVSAPAATAAASAFGALSNRVSLPADGQTLEDVVRDLLRPMLRDWLDRNLPGIVEQRVQAEVDRISRLNVR